MEKLFFATAVGPQGGIAAGCISGPLKTLKDAELWASKQIGKYPNIQVMEVIGYFKQVAPVVAFQPVYLPVADKPAPDVGIKNDEIDGDKFYRSDFL